MTPLERLFQKPHLYETIRVEHPDEVTLCVCEALAQALGPKPKRVPRERTADLFAEVASVLEARWQAGDDRFKVPAVTLLRLIQVRRLERGED